MKMGGTEPPTEEEDSKKKLLNQLFFSAECLDGLAFVLMSTFIFYTLAKYRRCSYDKMSLIVMIIFWLRYLVRFVYVIVSLSTNGEFNYNSVFDSIFSPVTFALAISSLELFIFRVRLKKITLESQN